MATRRFKRPSSARRNIKQECFSPYVSSSRLRNIQSLLSSEETGDGNPDAILCVLGIDSRYNEGSLELVNYLLFNFFDSRKTELEKSGFAEEVIDDLMFVIRAHSVAIYCNPINYQYMLPYVAHWKNLQFHCLRDEVYEDDEEKAEEFKIQSLIAMTDGCSQHSSESFDKMAVEKWPIVQAYALEGMGGGTFFTMKHTVTDFSSKLQHIYNLMDPVALETMVTEQLPLFERQWSTLLSNVDLDMKNRGSKITEGRISEPLQSYFSHGRLGSAKGPRSRPSAREPFVLFGTHTSRQYLENTQKARISSDAQLSSTATPGASTAQHMICQAVSPRSPICCRRTYFFTHAVLPYPLSSSQNNEPLPNFEKSDVRVLQLVYHACIDAVVAAIQCYAETLSVTKAEGIARQVLVESCDKTRPRVRPRHLVGKETVEFSLNAYNNHNSIVPLEEGVSTQLVKTLGMTVFDIPSVEFPGQSMGSVSYAESFLESTVRVQKPDDRIEIDGKALLLTGHIPRLLSWPCGAEHESVKCLQEHIIAASTFSAALGRTLVSGETAQLATHSGLFVLEDGHLHLYENGLIYLHPHQAPVVLPKQELAALHFYDGDSSSVVALLILTYKEGVRAHVPTHLRCPSHQVLLAFKPKSKVYKALFSEVLSVWKEEDATPKLTVLEELPEELQDVHSQLQAAYKFQSLSHPTHLQQAKAKLPDLDSFVSHFACSSVSSLPLPSKHLPLAVGMDWDAGYFGDSTEQLVLTLLTGPPGGGKEAVCHSVCKLGQWATIKQPEEMPDAFQPSLLHSSLSSLWANNKKQAKTEGKVRGLLLVPGLSSTIDVIQTIMAHPDKDLASKIRIGAVTVCMDPDSVYMCDNMLLPSLLDQCAQGWVNNIIFATNPNSKTKDLARLQSLVRASNSDVALLVVNNGEVSRSTELDLILSETAFDAPAMLQARYLSCPGWSFGAFTTGAASPAMAETILHFSQPLDKTRFNSKLKSSHTLMAKHYPYAGNIYHIRGRLAFTDSASQVYMMDYNSLSDHLSLIPSSPQHTANGSPSPSFMAFYGCQLQEEKLKDWLRACVIPKPEKRLKRTRASLTKTEINRLHKEHHLDALPEGWFYNGSKFVSMAGDKSDTHPNLEEFITEYIAQVNRDVDTYNAKIDRMNYHDLFE